MQAELRQVTGCPVRVVDTLPQQWLLTVRMPGWATVLDRLHLTVETAAKASPTGKVTLVGHSIGGVLARLYLSPQPFHGRRYNGIETVDCLVTLGSPHYNLGGMRRGGPLSRWVEEHYPGAAYSSQVRYIAVAGRWLRGSQFGPPLARFVYGVYRDICGSGAVWGDGIIPVESALLAGAKHLILDDTSHYTLFGEPWYGSRQAILSWWNAVGDGS